MYHRLEGGFLNFVTFNVKHSDLCCDLPFRAWAFCYIADVSVRLSRTRSLNPTPQCLSLAISLQSDPRPFFSQLHFVPNSNRVFPRLQITIFRKIITSAEYQSGLMAALKHSARSIVFLMHASEGTISQAKKSVSRIEIETSRKSRQKFIDSVPRVIVSYCNSTGFNATL